MRVKGDVTPKQSASGFQTVSEIRTKINFYGLYSIEKGPYFGQLFPLIIIQNVTFKK